ncbi:hypothetical protein NPIL_415971 [Nephila pilipes]|uniref:Uncharacterized protein n=1 Tax=Nephila pilipes TaxID=299642 RepID=A0A8X6R0J8_NEPPI|nr:hypothetical protein NPIL_415971 [Nephila pilipes]
MVETEVRIVSPRQDVSPSTEMALQLIPMNQPGSVRDRAKEHPTTAEAAHPAFQPWKKIQILFIALGGLVEDVANHGDPQNHVVLKPPGQDHPLIRLSIPKLRRTSLRMNIGGKRGRP